MTPYRIILADDHALLRQGLRRIVEESLDVRVVGEAGNGLELLELMKKTVADMVILDVSMPGLRGIEAMREIKHRYPGVKALILTMHRDIQYLHQALAQGADGYLLKEDADTELFSAVQHIREGRAHISSSLENEMNEYRRRMSGKEAGTFSERDCLTPREKEVLTLVAEGRSSKEVADLLYISTRTVEHHRARIMDKLEVRKTADLVKYAINNRYIQVLAHA